MDQSSSQQSPRKGRRYRLIIGALCGPLRKIEFYMGGFMSIVCVCPTNAFADRAAWFIPPANNASASAPAPNPDGLASGRMPVSLKATVSAAPKVQASRVVLDPVQQVEDATAPDTSVYLGVGPAFTIGEQGASGGSGLAYEAGLDWKPSPHFGLYVGIGDSNITGIKHVNHTAYGAITSVTSNSLRFIAMGPLSTWGPVTAKVGIGLGVNRMETKVPLYGITMPAQSLAPVATAGIDLDLVKLAGEFGAPVGALRGLSASVGVAGAVGEFARPHAPGMRGVRGLDGNVQVEFKISYTF